MRSTPVSIGSVNSPRAVSGLLARNARIRTSVASRSCSGMPSIPALVASVATRESAVRRCPCGNSACSGKPNRAIEPLLGRCASAVAVRQPLKVPRGPMAALPLTRASSATHSTRSSKTFHRPARMPSGSPWPDSRLVERVFQKRVSQVADVPKQPRGVPVPFLLSLCLCLGDFILFALEWLGRRNSPTASPSQRNAHRR
jgi:hypothetical protein